MSAAPAPKRVMMLAFKDCQILDVIGPLQMLAAVNEPGRTHYAIEIVAEEAGPLRSNAGLQLVADRGFADIRPADLRRIHTFMVSGGTGTRAALNNAALIDFAKRASEAAERVVSICTGSFILAAAGVLSGKRATTHWSMASRLASAHPAVMVDADAIYVRDGKTWTSAGVTSGMDLAIALVEADHGRDAALAVAREHVLYMMRPGGQSQFSAELKAQGSAGRTSRAVSYIAGNLARDLSMPALAEAAALSERTLLRAFREELGTTPAAYVQQARIDAARGQLSAGRSSVEQVARRCGFGSSETMRRAFHQAFGISPADYRARFATAQRPQLPIEGGLHA